MEEDGFLKELCESCSDRALSGYNRISLNLFHQVEGFAQTKSYRLELAKTSVTAKGCRIQELRHTFRTIWFVDSVFL